MATSEQKNPWDFNPSTSEVGFDSGFVSTHYDSLCEHDFLIKHPLWFVAGTKIARMHGAGVLHCDLHPGNILMASSGRVALSDFSYGRHTPTDPSTMAFDLVALHAKLSPTDFRTLISGYVKEAYVAIATPTYVDEFLDVLGITSAALPAPRGAILEPAEDLARAGLVLHWDSSGAPTVVVKGPSLPSPDPQTSGNIFSVIVNLHVLGVDCTEVLAGMRDKLRGSESAQVQLGLLACDEIASRPSSRHHQSLLRAAARFPTIEALHFIDGTIDVADFLAHFLRVSPAPNRHINFYEAAQVSMILMQTTHSSARNDERRLQLVLRRHHALTSSRGASQETADMQTMLNNLGYMGSRALLFHLQFKRLEPAPAWSSILGAIRHYQDLIDLALKIGTFPLSSDQEALVNAAVGNAINNSLASFFSLFRTALHNGHLESMFPVPKFRTRGESHILPEIDLLEHMETTHKALGFRNEVFRRLASRYVSTTR